MDIRCIAGLLKNEKIAALIHEIQGDIESGNDVGEKLSELRQISIHYAEKGDLVYPVLKVRYEISGPSDVMWTVDDEIRDELAALDKISDYNEEWINRLQTVLKRADEMIYKENNILYPICAVNFSREEWYGIYEDAKDYAPVFGVEIIWDEAEKYNTDKKARTEDYHGKYSMIKCEGQPCNSQEMLYQEAYDRAAIKTENKVVE